MQSVRNLNGMSPKARVRNLLEVGAGEGINLVALTNQNIAYELSAIEISVAEVIHNESIKNLVKVEMLD